MKFNKKNMIRWLKKGWLTQLIMFFVGVGFNVLIGFSFFNALNKFAENPTINQAFAFGIVAIIFIFGVMPIINGYVIEWVNKKVK